MAMGLPQVDAMQLVKPGSALDPARLSELNSIADPRARAEAVATQLEDVFMEMLVKSMRATVPDDGLLGKGLGRRTYVELLDQQWAALGGMPRDPRFHEALVRQIMGTVDEGLMVKDEP
jgi:Rod binding domain-containing protein